MQDHSTLHQMRTQALRHFCVDTAFCFQNKLHPFNHFKVGSGSQPIENIIEPRKNRHRDHSAEDEEGCVGEAENGQKAIDDVKRKGHVNP